MIFALIGTFIAYILSYLFLKSVLDFYYLNWQTVIKIIIITLITWMPFYIVDKFKRFCYPEAHEKLNSI